VCLAISSTQECWAATVDANFDVSEALAEVACFADQSVRFGLSLQDIAEVAEKSVPGFDHVSITLLQSDGRLETGPSTSPLALQMDHTQYALHEGPCLEAARGESLVSVPRLRFERRWPYYVPQAVAVGVKSHLAVPFCLDGKHTSGSVNLYSTTTEHISRESEAMAELFGFRSVTDLSNTTARPSPTLDSLTVIGQALGIVMNRFDIDPDHAFDYLDESATRADLDLHEYAEQLVEHSGMHVSRPNPSERPS
jgi:hypothetical protein